ASASTGCTSAAAARPRNVIVSPNRGISFLPLEFWNCVDFRNSEPAEVAEFLHALALHFGAVDVALAVDADEVEIVELAELMADAADGAHEVSAGAIDHVELAVRVVDDEQIGLRRVRPF